MLHNCLEALRQRQHVPVEEYASNLEAILREARAAGIAHLLLITPPPVHEPGRVAHQQMVSCCLGGVVLEHALPPIKSCLLFVNHNRTLSCTYVVKVQA
jgi:hypothetical protein